MRLWQAGVIVIGFAVTSCAAATQASFSISSAQCGSDPNACLQRCKSENDPSFCDVGNVMVAEGLAKPGPSRDSASATDIQAAIDRIAGPCKDGVARACRAADALKPVLEEKQAKADVRAKLVARFNAALEMLANVHVAMTDVDVRFFTDDRMKFVQNAQQQLETAKNDSLSVTDLIRQRAPVDQLEPAIANIEKEAHVLSDASNRLATEQRGEREQTAAMAEAKERNKREKEAHKRAIEAARQTCGETGDGPLTQACFDGCKADVGSAYCVVLAAYYKDGVKVTPDRAKSNALIQAACDAGNSTACDLFQDWTRKAEAEKAFKADRAKAEASLPGLFEKCQSQRAIVIGLRAQVEAAAHAQDRSRVLALDSVPVAGARGIHRVFSRAASKPRPLLRIFAFCSTWLSVRASVSMHGGYAVGGCTVGAKGAVVSSYLSIDSSRSSGSEDRVQGPRRSIGCESGGRRNLGNEVSTSAREAFARRLLKGHRVRSGPYGCSCQRARGAIGGCG